MKDNFTAIILSAVIIFLVGAGVVLVGNQGDVNVSSTSNPSNNAEGSPQVSNPQDNAPSIGATQRPDIKITKYLDYDDITTTSVAITNPTTGSYIVDNVFIETGANTMASGTLFQVYTKAPSAKYGYAYGTSTVLFSAAVGALTANVAVDLNTAIGSATTYVGYASSTQRVVLDDQEQLYAKCTTASCKLSQIETEIGEAGKNMRVTIVLKPTDSDSNIYE